MYLYIIQISSDVYSVKYSKASPPFSAKSVFIVEDGFRAKSILRTVLKDKKIKGQAYTFKIEYTLFDKKCKSVVKYLGGHRENYIIKID